MKNSSDTVGDRTRDLPVCNAVPQPTALRRELPGDANIDLIKLAQADIFYTHLYNSTLTMANYFCCL